MSFSNIVSKIHSLVKRSLLEKGFAIESRGQAIVVEVLGEEGQVFLLQIGIPGEMIKLINP